MTDPDTLHTAHLAVMTRIEPAQAEALQRLRDRLDDGDE